MQLAMLACWSIGARVFLDIFQLSKIAETEPKTKND